MFCQSAQMGIGMSTICECEQLQTVNHVVNMCPLTKFESGLQSLHDVEDDTLSWLEITAITAVVKLNKFYPCFYAKLQCYMLMCVCVCFVQFVAALVSSHCLH